MEERRGREGGGCVVIKLGEGWRRVDFNDGYRDVGGWWRNLEFGG